MLIMTTAFLAVNYLFLVDYYFITDQTQRDPGGRFWTWWHDFEGSRWYNMFMDNDAKWLETPTSLLALFLANNAHEDPDHLWSGLKDIMKLSVAIRCMMSASMGMLCFALGGFLGLNFKTAWWFYTNPYAALSKDECETLKGTIEHVLHDDEMLDSEGSSYAIHKWHALAARQLRAFLAAPESTDDDKRESLSDVVLRLGTYCQLLREWVSLLSRGGNGSSAASMCLCKWTARIQRLRLAFWQLINVAFG